MICGAPILTSVQRVIIVQGCHYEENRIKIITEGRYVQENERLPWCVEVQLRCVAATRHCFFYVFLVTYTVKKMKKEGSAL